MAWDHLTGKQRGENAPAYRHGEAALRTPEYRSWKSMFTRCENPNHEAYDRYGGRGIKICERWRDYRNFIADMGRRPTMNHTLDRIDNDKGYGPGNCRWATRRVQLANRRVARTISCDGETLCLAEAARRKGISGALLRWRIEAGWPEADALMPAGWRRT